MRLADQLHPDLIRAYNVYATEGVLLRRFNENAERFEYVSMDDVLRVEQALGKLSKREQLFLMLVCEGYSYEEIEQELGIVREVLNLMRRRLGIKLFGDVVTYQWVLNYRPRMVAKSAGIGDEETRARQRKGREFGAKSRRRVPADPLPFHLLGQKETRDIDRAA